MLTVDLYHLRRRLLKGSITQGLQGYAKVRALLPEQRVSQSTHRAPPTHPTTPEDFRPLETGCFQNPYAFYRMLRDEYPVYRLRNGIYCISRYDDIQTVSRDTNTFSSEHQGVIANLKPGQDLLQQVRRFEKMTALGIIPADVLATSDPPQHTVERKIGHTSLNAHFVKSLEPEVEKLSTNMLAPLLDAGEMEFMQAFGWRLPMVLIIRLLGLPEQDFTKIKKWCVDTLNSQNGIQTSAELAQSYVSAINFLDYCWTQYLKVKTNPGNNLMGILAKSADDAATPFDDKKAVSAIFQLLIAGSDSSATTMGNALKLLIERLDLQEKMRADPALVNDFIEEVFRLESAFQGHFRWVTKDTALHGVQLPRGSRIFLMWAAGNRDERFFENPDELILGRKNGKKHLTFGHGLHACLGRELARMEIRIVLQQFLTHTRNLHITGETPFVASMFARTLVTLPIRFERATKPAALG
ncbi:cytochrome P450 [gamma proteobacterium HdN1]|nr:cytochrome P450 [gamma proteobacterium HdN1]